MFGHFTSLQLQIPVAVGVQNRNVKFYWHFVLRMMTSCNCQGVYVTIFVPQRGTSLRWFLAQIRFLARSSSGRPAIFFFTMQSTFSLCQKNIQYMYLCKQVLRSLYVLLGFSYTFLLSFLLLVTACSSSPTSLFRKKRFRSTFCSGKTHQNLPYLQKKKTHVDFFFIFSNFEFYLMNSLVYVDIDQGIYRVKLKVARNEKRKKKLCTWVFFFYKYGKI